MADGCEAGRSFIISARNARATRMGRQLPAPNGSSAAKPERFGRPTAAISAFATRNTSEYAKRSRACTGSLESPTAVQ